MRNEGLTWKAVWIVSGTLIALLLCMPSLLVSAIWALYALTGDALWVKYEETPWVSDILGYPQLVLLGNWPVLVVALITWRAQARCGNPKAALIRNAATILALAAPNIPLWIAIPESSFSNDYDAFQGIGVYLAIFIFVSPVVAIVGWGVGWIATLGMST